MERAFSFTRVWLSACDPVLPHFLAAQCTPEGLLLQPVQRKGMAVCEELPAFKAFNLLQVEPKKVFGQYLSLLQIHDLSSDSPAWGWNPLLFSGYFQTYMTAETSLRKREVITTVWYWVCVTARKHLGVYKWRRVKNHHRLRWFVFEVRLSLILNCFCVFVDPTNFLEKMHLMMAFPTFLPDLLVGISLWVKMISQESLQLKEFGVQEVCL